MKKFLNIFYKNPICERAFHTLVYCLRRELKDCETVLDLGCGPSSPVQFAGKFKRKVGVEIFVPYLERSRAQGIHDEYFNKKIEELEFRPKSFDAVIMIDVIEHMSKEDALATLKLAEKWAKKKVIISSPNGFVPQKELDGNPYQVHLSGWPVNAMKEMGYRSKGLAGLKVLRQENDDPSMGDNILSSIRLRPRFFWFVISTLSQILVYYFPRLAFGLFSVKRLEPQKF